MARAVTLFTGQWADLGLEKLAAKAAEFGYDGLELACWGDHFEVHKALDEKGYCKEKWQLLKDHGLDCYAISAHLVGQCVCDNIDGRHQAILSPELFGDGDPEGVRQRAADEMKNTARAARKFFDAAPAAVKKKHKRVVVNGFTGSSIWPLLYGFPPAGPEMIEAGYKDFARRWRSILQVFQAENVLFALEVHPTEIAFDISSSARALKAIGSKRFGFNYDPSHLGYQGVNYVQFIRQFGDRIYHVHMKDVWWSPVPTRAGVFGGHTSFGDPDRYWDFRSLGRGAVDFEEIIRALNDVGYDGPLSVEWEDGKMDREHGAAEACEFVKALDFTPSAIRFDEAFEKE